MNYQTARSAKSLPTISLDEGSKLLDAEDCADCLDYYAWPEVYGSTSGPFPGLAGQAMTTFTVEAWVSPEAALLFCNGRVIRKVPMAEFTPLRAGMAPSTKPIGEASRGR
jgi:hypothetical protein